MSYRLEKNGSDNDLVVFDFDKGIGPSPHKGIGNLQNVNIATEEGEVMAAFQRSQANATSTSTTGTISFIDSTHIGISISGANSFSKGMWITVGSSSHPGELADGLYYVLPSLGGGFQLATSPTGSIITGYTSGLTATVNYFRTMSRGVAQATELYNNSGTTYYRYYILDSQGLVWVYDTINEVLYSSSDNVAWFLPDNSISYFSTDAAPSGLCVLNGFLLVFSGNKIWGKPTVNLSSSYSQLSNALLMSKANTTNPHFALVGHQGRAYYTDGVYIGSIFPDTSILTGVANVQSYAQYTAVTTTGTISQLIAGSLPSAGPNVGQTGFSRIPAVFFPATGGTKPTAITVGTVYYIQYATGNENFEVYAALTGGSAIDIATGSSGSQYFNTFWPLSSSAGAYGSTPLMTFSPERLNLPTFEIAQCMTEVGNLVIIGGRTNALYPWNQVDVTPSTIVPLPEGNVVQLLTANQMVYVFAGNKGNIYITDGNTASLVLKVPDYCAGVPGTPYSYIEPVFTWGGVAFVRGRVYFSVLDQTLATDYLPAKAGNCGGIWSFYPTQNIAFNQDTGPALHVEAINSYDTYSGYATVIVGLINQAGYKNPQYWAAWQSSLTSPAYGIDKTIAGAYQQAIVETDFLPVGTYLNKYTPKQIEYKLAAEMTTGESVQIYWRKNTTDAWTSCGTVVREGATAISGYFNANFQGAQWVQLRVVLIPTTGTGSSFLRLAQVRMR